MTSLSLLCFHSACQRHKQRVYLYEKKKGLRKCVYPPTLHCGWAFGKLQVSESWVNNQMDEAWKEAKFTPLHISLWDNYSRAYNNTLFLCVAAFSLQWCTFISPVQCLQKENLYVDLWMIFFAVVLFAITRKKWHKLFQSMWFWKLAKFWKMWQPYIEPLYHLQKQRRQNGLGLTFQ